MKFARAVPATLCGHPRADPVMPMTVHDRAPRLRGCRRAEPGAAGFAGWVEGAGIALPGGPAPTARAWRGACVHRSAQARVSRQYHRMSSHALPPSGIIWSCGNGMPHSQHATTVARRPAGPVGEEVPVASAMTASPPHREPLSVRVGWGSRRSLLRPRLPRCARLRVPPSSREMLRWALARRPASVALVGLVVIPARCSQTDAARAVLPRYAARAAPSEHPTVSRRCQRRYSANEARGCGYTLSEPSAGSPG